MVQQPSSRHLKASGSRSGMHTLEPDWLQLPRPLPPAVTSVVTLLRAFTPGMVQRNRGHIIFIGRQGRACNRLGTLPGLCTQRSAGN